MSLGEQLRDYLPVAVAAKHLADIAVRRRDTGVINICSGEPCSIRRLVESWLQDNRWNIKLDLGQRPYPDYEPLAFWGDRTKLDFTLGSP
jgi:dTDP-6-deoxy-L-talose 4-dehydrogenase (NAD+)